VASLGLLMTDSVELSNVKVFAEPHKGTRAGPSDHGGGALAADGRLVELSHVIRAGMITYPGLPGPEITPVPDQGGLSGRGTPPRTEFAIDQLTLVGNTATWLDAPYHRYADGADLSAIPLAGPPICRPWWPGWPARNSAVSMSVPWRRSRSAAGRAAARRRRCGSAQRTIAGAPLPGPGRRGLAGRP
jgi:hypothetical protein